MHTVDQARQLWCPHARVAALTPIAGEHKGEGLAIADVRDGQSIYNRLQSNDGAEFAFPVGARCIATNCSQWRWFNEQGTHGYCGLSGKPEFG